MLVFGLAIGMAAAGGFLSMTGGWTSSSTWRLVFHIAIVAWLSLAIALATQWIGGIFATLLMGAWFVALAVIYAGHIVAVRSWGSPMSRSVLLHSVRRIPYFARMHIASAIGAGVALTAVFAGSSTASHFDLPASNSARAALQLGAICALSIAGAIIRSVARISPRTDLIVGIVLGGLGPMPGPPPNDPSLGRRGQFRSLDIRRDANVILFVIDSLRPRNMSVFGYPRPTTPFLKSLLDRSGARAVPMAVTSSPSTDAALWSLFSSRRVRHQAVNAPCLHDLLRAAGYSARFFLSGAHRHWMGLESLYGTDHDGFLDELIDEQLLAEARKLSARGAARRNLFFFHLMSAHGASGCEPPALWTPAVNRFAYDEGDDLDAAARERMVNHYDNSVRQADDCLRETWKALEVKGFLEDAVVVVTGDHGEAIGDRLPVMIGHGRGLHQESIQVPLIVWDSTRTLAAPAFMADQTDISPTILEMLGMAAPSTWQGSSIWSMPGRRSAHIEHIAHRVGAQPIHMEAILALLPSGVLKMMRYRQAGSEILRRTFCLSADPDENRDLTGHLDTRIEAKLNDLFREYDERPSLAFSTSWKYLGERRESCRSSRALASIALRPPA